jgi:hypothetical protein
MIETGGLVLLFAWGIFFALLLLLAVFVLRGHVHPIDESKRTPDDPPDVP